MYNPELDTNKMSLAWHYSQVENNYSDKTKFSFPENAEEWATKWLNIL